MNFQYSSLDLGRESGPVKDLLSRVEDEARQQTIVLSPIYSGDGQPPYFTQIMSDWYSYYIQPYRGEALDFIVREFGSQTLGKSVRGILFENARDKIELSKLQAIGRERETFDQLKEVADVRTELDDKKAQYEALKAQYGRDAIKATPILYWLIIIISMVPEFLINWESFLKIPLLMGTPALVLGSVSLVAGFFGFSAHRVGMIIKQWQDRFGGDVSNTDRWKSARELSIALTLFSIAMSIVIWGRYLLVADIIRERDILSGGGFGAEQLILYGGAILGNVGVYLFAVLWSFVKHDAVQGFSELRGEVETLQNRQSQLVEKYLTRRNQRHILAAQKALDKAKQQEKSQIERLEGYKESRQLFAEIRKKDEQVVALLKEYRTLLLAKARANKQLRYFYVEDIAKVDVDTYEWLTPDQYASISLELRYI